jgi:hypothetical protein
MIPQQAIEKMTEDDECAFFFQALLESEPSFRNASVDPEPLPGQL